MRYGVPARKFMIIIDKFLIVGENVSASRGLSINSATDVDESPVLIAP